MPIANRSAHSTLAAAALAFCAGAGIATPAVAQDSAPARAGADNAARTLTTSKCTQCHGDNIWRDQRLDARGWEATLYRMVGRGAVWSGDDIKTMASFLAADFGPGAPRAAPVQR
jgi:hypothetical protein